MFICLEMVLVVGHVKPVRLHNKHSAKTLQTLYRSNECDGQTDGRRRVGIHVALAALFVTALCAEIKRC